MTETQLTAEEVKAKEEAELKASLLAKEKVTQVTLTKEQQDQAIKDKELSDAQKLRIYEIQQKTVREQGARLSKTEKELSELKAAKEEAAKPTVTESSKAFYANPVKMIEEALEKAIAPLNAFKDRFESDSEYVRIKRNLMTNPVFAQHLSNPQFASVVDEIVLAGQKAGTVVTEDSL